jgi:hypothetical protein
VVKNNAYFASLGFYSDPGWTLADQVNQLTSNIKKIFFINDRLNLTLSTQASVRDQSAPGSYDSLRDGVNEVQQEISTLTHLIMY